MRFKNPCVLPAAGRVFYVNAATEATLITRRAQLQAMPAARFCLDKQPERAHGMYIPPFTCSVSPVM
jgi:hypothetical protein